MDSYADVTCVLSMNIDCQACKMQVLEVLSSIIGVYNVEIDANAGQVRVSGEVDPNGLLKAIARTGRHAKLAWAKLNHPTVHQSYHGHGPRHAYYNYGHAGLEDPYCHGRRYSRNWAMPHAGAGWSYPHDSPFYNTPYYHGQRFRPSHF